MPIDNSHLIARAKAIRDDVNLLEHLHKTCQLTELGLVEPILNESRYLARALADLLYYEVGDDRYLEALKNAEHAIRCAINDAVDSLVTFIKKCLQNLKKDYPKFKIAICPFGEKYVAALQAIEKVDGKIVRSRTERESRLDIYKDLAKSADELKTIAQFALLLPQIEAIAQIEMPEFAVGENNHASDVWLIDHIRQAMGTQGGEAKFSLEFQPKYDCAGGSCKCVGAEALLRLKIGETSISPVKFIKFAERNGLISELGLWVMRETLIVLKQHDEIPCISVNVSSIELLAPDYSANVKSLIDEFGVTPSRLELEITESAAINDSGSEHHLEKITELGVRIAIDDFGTGETKFDYLAMMKVSVIKIDMSLVRRFDKTPLRYGPLMKAISAIGQSCGIDLIAEGVETQLQADALKSININTFQGYLYGRSEPIVQFCAKHKF